jgi:hypothetical protein
MSQRQAVQLSAVPGERVNRRPDEPGDDIAQRAPRVHACRGSRHATSSTPLIHRRKGPRQVPGASFEHSRGRDTPVVLVRTHRRSLVASTNTGECPHSDREGRGEPASPRRIVVEAGVRRPIAVVHFVTRSESQRGAGLIRIGTVRRSCLHGALRTGSCMSPALQASRLLVFGKDARRSPSSKAGRSGPRSPWEEVSP